MLHRISRSDHPQAKAPKDAQRAEAERVIVVTALISLALFSRAFPDIDLDQPDYLDIAAIACGLLPLAWALVTQILVLAKARKAMVLMTSQDSRFMGIALMVWGLAASGVDLLLGRFPIVFYFAALLCGLLYWNRLKLVSLLVLPAALALTAFRILIPARGLAFVPGLVDIAFAVFFAYAAAFLVKRDTMPSEERLKSLEIENKELWNLSFRDGLTALYNRRFAQETGQALFNRAARYHEEFHVLMIDIDHFKQVNDKLGHAVGDEVLKGVSEVIRSNVRGSDVAARYGGEEFIIFVVRAEPELVQYIANRIRDGMASHVFPEVSWQVTVSIGVAGMRTTDSFDELVERADRNLYISKHSGRNRVSGF